MRIIKHSLPILFLAAIFSFNECKRLEAATQHNTESEFLPESVEILKTFSSPRIRRIAEQQLAALELERRESQAVFSP